MFRNEAIEKWLTATRLATNPYDRFEVWSDPYTGEGEWSDMLVVALGTGEYTAISLVNTDGEHILVQVLGGGAVLVERFTDAQTAVHAVCHAVSGSSDVWATLFTKEAIHVRRWD